MAMFGVDKLASPSKHLAITTSNTVAQPEIRRIVWLTDGTAVIEDAYGTVITYTLTAGDYLDFTPKYIKNASTATFAGQV